MKRFYLKEEERRTLFEMGMWHSHPRVRRRAQALVRLAQGITQTRAAQEFDVHLNSLRGWMMRWQTKGLVGLHEEPHEGRPPKLSPAMAERLRQVAEAEGGTIDHIMTCMAEQQMALMVTPDTVARWLKAMGFSYKRYRTSLKKARCSACGALPTRAGSVVPAGTDGPVSAVFFDESGFSPNPPIQYRWSVRGQTRTCTPGTHRQRVNVLGCLQKGVRLIWESVTQPVKREHVIAFFDRLVEEITYKTVVILDNAAIHHGQPMKEKQEERAKKGLHLLYLPLYSPELNAIEILWKQAKYFRRRFIALSGHSLDSTGRCHELTESFSRRLVV